MARPAEFDDQARRSLFSAQAETYGDGRPGYPQAVFDALSQSCGLGPDCAVVEIGPGAGQATRGLLDAGADVVAIEVGDAFVDRLRTQFDRRPLRVVLGDFATVELQLEPVDLVVAATSFHWVDPHVGLHRAADLLRPGGSVALWWNHYGDPDRPDPFRQALQPILEKYVPEFADASDGDAGHGGGAGIGAHPYALDVEARLGEIENTGRFGSASHHIFAWEVTQTATDVQRFLTSLSHWMALEDDRRTAILKRIADLIDDDFGGTVERPYLTALYTASAG